MYIHGVSQGISVSSNAVRRKHFHILLLEVQYPKTKAADRVLLSLFPMYETCTMMILNVKDEKLMVTMLFRKS